MCVCGCVKPLGILGCVSFDHEGHLSIDSRSSVSGFPFFPHGVEVAA